MSPVEFGTLVDRSVLLRREQRYGFAMVCAVISNIYNDREKNPDGWSADDFMPGAKSEADDFEEFIAEIQNGCLQIPDGEAVRVYMRNTARKMGIETGNA